MAKQDKGKLRDWFSTGKFPTQEQFWDWMDSFVHKDDKLDIILNFPELDKVLQQKADKEVMIRHFDDDKNPHRVSKAQVGLGNADNTMDIDKPISRATQTALDLKAGKAALALHAKDNTNPHKVTKKQVGLGQADNTADLDKPISRDTKAALYLKADKEAVDFHLQDNKNPHQVTKAQVGLGNADNTADVDKPVSKAAQGALDLKAEKEAVDNHLKDDTNPHKTTKAQVGLGNVNDTADVDKPVSKATQSALELKAEKIVLDNHLEDAKNPHKVTKAQVGLSNADNTKDADKPISKATKTALDLKANKEHTHAASTLTGFDTDPTLNANSDEKVASQKAVKTYVDAATSALQTQMASIRPQLMPGMIIAWKGALNTIPEGWRLCAELKDKFILGAGDDFKIGNTGGARTHTLTEKEMPSHKHQIKDAVILKGSNNLGVFAMSDSSKSEIGLCNTNVVGGDKPHNNMPPYYVLAYIEYIGV